MHTLAGHTNAVATVKCQAAEPQIITGMVEVVYQMHTAYPAIHCYSQLEYRGGKLPFQLPESLWKHIENQKATDLQQCCELKMVEYVAHFAA